MSYDEVPVVHCRICGHRDYQHAFGSTGFFAGKCSKKKCQCLHFKPPLDNPAEKV